MNTLRHCHASNATRRFVGVVLLALLLAQWTALAHALAHGPLHMSSEPAAEAETPWGHGADSAACQLIDQLLTGQATGAGPSAEPGFWVATPLAAAPDLPIARGLALRAYEARGPPLDVATPSSRCARARAT